MIDEAIGKILGMAMAYGVSVLGLFLAYVNYRRRIVRAERVMTGTAWAVVAVTLLAVAGGVLVVTRLASGARDQAALQSAEQAATEALPEVEAPVAESLPPEVPREERWPLIGIVVPMGIFLFATVLTAALHRHFSHPASS